jgi:AbrB family looped-hinge helix DNA binding protein
VGSRVGAKGQIVIEKAIRDKLGIAPGSIAVQQIVDDHVEIRFLRPRHNRSLFGAARPFVTRWPTPEELEDTESAWAEAAAQKDRELVEELRRHGRDRRDERADALPDGRPTGAG